MARLTTGHAESDAINHGIQAALKLLQQQLAGHTLRPCCLLEVVAELAFLSEVDALGFLLLAQLQTVAYDLVLAVLAVLAWSKVALLNRTFIGETFWPLEEQLHTLAAA